MANTGDIQRRIKSVKNTKKITKAMELVSAAKMRKAVEAVLATRSYANLSWLTVLNLAEISKKDKSLHKLLKPSSTTSFAQGYGESKKATAGETKKVGIILITSNRGLCGGFNSSIINKVIKSVGQHNGEIETEFVLLGKKGAQINYKYGYNLVAEFDKPDVITEIEEVIPVAKILIKDYLNSRYNKIMLAYTDFVSVAKQVPRVKQLLPIDLNERDDYLGVIGPSDKDQTSPLQEGGAMTKEIIEEKKEKYFTNKEYIFEPSAHEVLDEMIPRLLEVQMFQAILESNASEHSARMMAMRNATDAASDMIDDLTLTYNKARQASITAEIAEIAGGAAALKKN